MIRSLPEQARSLPDGLLAIQAEENCLLSPEGLPCRFEIALAGDLAPCSRDLEDDATITVLKTSQCTSATLQYQDTTSGGSANHSFSPTLSYNPPYCLFPDCSPRYASSDENIATVDSASGMVYGNAGGQVTITVSPDPVIHAAEA